MAELILTEAASVTAPGTGLASFYDDSIQLYRSSDALAGVAMAGVMTLFKLTGNGSAIGAGIADYFGANSAFPTETNGIYLFSALLYFLKSTAGTVTITLTNTQTYTNIAASLIVSGDLAVGAAGTQTGIVTTTTAAAALPATGSLADTKNHRILVVATIECATAGNIRVRATESAGTITPLRGSYYTMIRIPAGNVGTFVA